MAPNDPSGFFFSSPRLFAVLLTINSTEIYQWKVDHNIFESREVAAEAKANEARRRRINEQKHENRLRDCRKTPKTARCRMLLLGDAEKQEVEEQGGDGVKKAIA